MQKKMSGVGIFKNFTLAQFSFREICEIIIEFDALVKFQQK